MVIKTSPGERKPGALIWNELLTTNSNKALSFYSSVFGNTIGVMYRGYTLSRGDGTGVAWTMDIAREIGPIPPHWMPYLCLDVRVHRANRRGSGGEGSGTGN